MPKVEKKSIGENASSTTSINSYLPQLIRSEIDRLDKNRNNLIDGLKLAAKVASSEGKNDLAAELLAVIPSEGKKEPEMSNSLKRLINELVKLPLKKQDNIAKSIIGIVSIQNIKED